MSCLECFGGLFGGGNVSQKKSDLKTAKGLLQDLIRAKSCGPILLRTAWHDAGTYNKANAGKPWPNAGGAIGSIRTPHEIGAPPNAGLQKAIMAYLQPIRNKVPGISWADLIQLAGATAVEEMGGPKIPMRYGRVDGEPTEKAAPPFGLPSAKPDKPGPEEAAWAAQHLREVFYKYGMNDKDIVALSGAHTVGRAFKDRSGTVEESSQSGTAYTRRGAPQAKQSSTFGGRSWTKNWLEFDNSYFSQMKHHDREVLVFPTDRVLYVDPGFKPHFELFAKDQAAFFAAYADAHQRLSELGSKFSPPCGISGL